MAKRRPSGDGMVRKRDDGRWEGRIVVGHKENGDSIFRYVYADNQKETVHKHNEALCNLLAFHLCISPFIPIDFRLLFRYCVACQSPIKY